MQKYKYEVASSEPHDMPSNGSVSLDEYRIRFHRWYPCWNNLHRHRSPMRGTKQTGAGMTSPRSHLLSDTHYYCHMELHNSAVLFSL